jgi:hypothetical protein
MAAASPHPAIAQENDGAHNHCESQGNGQCYQQIFGLTPLSPGLLPGIQNPANKIHGHNASDCVSDYY